MRTQLEIICASDEEIAEIDTFVDENEICTVDIAIHDDRVTLNAFWLLHSSESPTAVAEENKRWLQFIAAFTARFPSNT